MIIIDKTSKGYKSVPFKDIKFGGTFVYNEEFFIKICVYESYSGQAYARNAISLKDEPYPILFDDKDIVYPVDAELSYRKIPVDVKQ